MSNAAARFWTRTLDEEVAGSDVRVLAEYDCGLEGFLQFVQDAFGMRLWSRQVDIARSVIEQRRTAVRSGHSVGKTGVVACLCEWFFCCKGWCIYTTGPGQESVKDLLWKEISSNREKALIPLPGGQVQASGQIKVPGHSDWWAKGFSTNTAERAQGKHSRNGILVVADEAAGIQDFTWDAMESSMASDDTKMLIIGNPNLERGYFYQAFHENKGMWTTHHVSSMDVPNVTGKEPNVKGLATLEWIKDQEIRLKADPQKFRCKILGEWPTSDAEDKVLPMDWIESAQQLWLELEEEEQDYADEPEIHSAFVDVAGWGKDSSSLVYLRGQRLHVGFVIDSKLDTAIVDLADDVNDWVCSLPAHQKPRSISVDCDAGGSGTHGALIKLRDKHKKDWGRCRIARFSWSQRPTLKRKTHFPHAIDELHWELRERIDPSRDRCERIAVPPGNEIAGQLNTRKWTEDVLEKKKVENKKEMRARGKVSPDIGDACVGCMYKPMITQMVAV